MNFPVESEDKKILNFKISFDMYGNLYFDGTHCDSCVYQISVNSKGELVAETGDYTILNDVDVDLKAIHLYEQGHKLRKKTLQNLEDEEIAQERATEDGHEDELESKYYIEEQEYFQDDDNFSDDQNTAIVDEENEKKFGHINKPFIFSSQNSACVIPVYNRNNGDICSLYDVYIYKANRIGFKSGSADDSSIYRIKLFDDGNFYFREVVNQDTKYKASLSNSGELVFTKVF